MAISRRNFLLRSAVFCALGALNSSPLKAMASLPPRRVALIGTGWYGKSDLFRLMQVAPVEIVGLCDVDQNQLTGAAKRIQERTGRNQALPLYNDYQKMLSEQRPEIVLIGSPDHWHALQAIDAIQTGAHVYLQKPISVDVLEGEAIVEAAHQHHRIVQVGTQRRSTPHLIEAKQQIVASGKLGKVHHAEVFCYYHMLNDSHPAIQAIPDTIDYNAWTGPAPLLPYRGAPHLGWWRSFKEYGNGIMGDMCVHMFDAVRWMLDLGWPERIYSTGGNFTTRKGLANIPDTQTASFEYPDFTCVWQHRTWGTAPDPEYPWGFKIYGENGTLSGSPYRYDFVPLNGSQKISGTVLYEKEQYPEDTKEEGIEIHAAPATRAHFRNFLNAIESGNQPIPNINEAHISTASCILANMSMELKRPLIYDPRNRIIPGDTVATALLSRQFCKGYTHPGLKCVKNEK